MVFKTTAQAQVRRAHKDARQMQEDDCIVRVSQREVLFTLSCRPSRGVSLAVLRSLRYDSLSEGHMSLTPWLH